jgi:hypothetical protein
VLFRSSERVKIRLETELGRLELRVRRLLHTRGLASLGNWLDGRLRQTANRPRASFWIALTGLLCALVLALFAHRSLDRRPAAASGPLADPSSDARPG